MKNINEIIADVAEPPKTFEGYLMAYADQVGDLVNTYLPAGTHPDMDRYLYAPLKRYSENGGKRHRPLICFAACLAVGGDMRLATSAAAAIEHFHTAALIHDDIADEAELRRGEPCMHCTEGIGLAINAGDLALSLVNGTVVEDPDLDDHTKVRVISELIEMTRRTIEGQALDIGWARDGRYDIAPEDYLVMATHKTAHYSGAVPLAVGAIIGGGTAEEVEALRSYGLDTGLGVPDPGRPAQPHRQRGVHEEGLSQRHHRGQAHAGGGARPGKRRALRRAGALSRSCPPRRRTRRCSPRRSTSCRPRAASSMRALMPRT